jgi:hypothetical protein
MAAESPELADEMERPVELTSDMLPRAGQAGRDCRHRDRHRLSACDTRYGVRLFLYDRG